MREAIWGIFNPPADDLKAAAETQSLTKAADLAEAGDLAAMMVELQPTFAPPSSALDAIFAPQQNDYWREAGPKIDWVVDGWLPGGRVSLLTGKGGGGKSKLALMLAAQLAMNTETHSGEARLWMEGGPTLGRPGRVVFASWEDDRATMRWRLCDWPHAVPVSKRGRHFDASDTLPHLLGDRLVFRDLAGHGPLWSLDPNNNGSRHTTIGDLTPLGRQLRDDAASANLLIVDPLAGAFACNENDRGQVRTFMASWDAWARETGCAVLFIAHPAKADSGESAEYSGSTDWFGAARAVLTLGRKSDDKTTRFQCIKNNYGALPKPLRLDHWEWWKADIDVSFPDGGGAPGVGRNRPPPGASS